jgi:hypothetical protein
MAKKVYGKSFPDLFSEWQNSIETASETTSWQIDGERLTEHGWDVTFPVLVKDKLYYIREYPKKSGALSFFNFAEIIERDLPTRKEKVVVSSTSWFVGGLEEIGGKLYYAEMELKKGYANSEGFGLDAILHEKNLAQGEDRVLFEDEMRNFTVLADGRIVYVKDKEHGFGSQLWTWSAGEGKRMLADFDLLICEILTLKDEKVAIVARPDWENWNIYLLSLNTKELKRIVETPFAEANISAAGKRLFFSANYEGKYSIYTYDLEEERFARLTFSGFASFPVFDERVNDLYFVGLTSSGFDLYRKKIERFDEFIMKDYQRSIQPAFPEIQAKKGGRLDYIKTLWPKIHMPYPTKDGAGIYLVGQDAIGENMYSFDFRYEKEEPEFILSCLTYRLKPSILSFDWKEEDEASFYWWYPLRSKISSPLSAWVVLGGREFERFKRKEVNPFLSFFLNFPKTKIGILADYSLERKKELGSTIDREAISSELFLSRYIKDSQVDLGLNGLCDPDNPDPKSLKIRGYDELKSNKWLAASLEYSRPLLKIRKGIWNPNLFFEDLCLSLFTDAGFSEKKTQLSGGIELKQEIGAFLLGNSVSTLGLTYNKEGETTAYLQLNF